jgi:hypothetical protein
VKKRASCPAVSDADTGLTATATAANEREESEVNKNKEVISTGTLLRAGILFGPYE